MYLLRYKTGMQSHAMRTGIKTLFDISNVFKNHSFKFETFGKQSLKDQILIDMIHCLTKSTQTF